MKLHSEEIRTLKTAVIELKTMIEELRINKEEEKEEEKVVLCGYSRYHSLPYRHKLETDHPVCCGRCDTVIKPCECDWDGRSASGISYASYFNFYICFYCSGYKERK